MIGRVVEIAGQGRYLHLDRGFLVVSKQGSEIGRTPIDDISALIGNAHGLSYSNNLLVALAERGVPFALCGRNHSPVAMLWPVQGHHRQAARMDGQCGAKLPLRKRLWKQVVQAKIGAQAAVLAHVGAPSNPVARYVGKVRAGDPSNVEGQAARVYWMLLFGRGFRRDRGMEGVNALLNYGYTVLRALVARHVMAAGLHPGIPLHHANAGNPMRLVDDLMEPFRPLVDVWVWRLLQEGCLEVDARSKRTLALLPTRTLRLPEGRSAVSNAVQRYAQTLAQCFEGRKGLPGLCRIDAEALAFIWEADSHAEETEED